MTTIENLKTIDPFADADEGDADKQKKGQDYIHIRIQQRNGRKTLTTIQGLPKRFDQKKILKVIKKKFACNGTIVEDQDLGEVLQLQGTSHFSESFVHAVLLLFGRSPPVRPRVAEASSEHGDTSPLM